MSCGLDRIILDEDLGVAGDDEEGIGMLANDSLNYGMWGDFVQYSTMNAEHNPVILRMISGAAYRDVVRQNFDRVEAEKAANQREAVSPVGVAHEEVVRAAGRGRQEDGRRRP